MADNSPKKIWRSLITAVVVLFLLAASTSRIEAASLSVSPPAGTFTVGSTFDVPIYLDTKNQAINAVAVFLKFPADKLQLTSPSTGRSIIEIWPSLPRFNNLTGEVELQGLVPGGINTSSGLITTLTFRVKSVGQATVRFTDQSKVLLNDGLGTDSLDHLNHGIYQLVLPPPAGPIVTSPTHPDSTKWVSDSNVVLGWAAADEVVEGYSYMMNVEPTTIPDDISEGVRTDVTYKNLPDGTHYFHIKALRRGVWGGVTHFAALVDITPPAEFPVEIIPSARTTRRQPGAQWSTTDNSSGLDHYELKLIPLTPGIDGSAFNDGGQPISIEVQSPYAFPVLERGQYDVIVRAYDRAGNSRESAERLSIVNAIFKPIADEGLEIIGTFTLTWLWVWIILAGIILSLFWLAVKIKHRHRKLDEHRDKKVLPESLNDQLEELKRYRAKYGKAALYLLTFGLLALLFGQSARAAEKAAAPPLVTTVSQAITNEDIFYIGGKTDLPNVPVVIYFQNLETGETSNFEIVSDEKGEWFYRHQTFLTSGDYQLWAQSRVNEEWSPPSPQWNMIVRPTALQFGSSRLSYSVLLFTVMIALLVVIIGLILHIIVHHRRARVKHQLLLKEVREAEESVRRGFAVLRRDINAELEIIKKAKLERELAEEEKQTEEHLLKDLSAVERYIGREIWEVEQAEG